MSEVFTDAMHYVISPSGVLGSVNQSENINLLNCVGFSDKTVESV